jgi:RNA polymerase sigma factor (sigma-70 family)
MADPTHPNELALIQRAQKGDLRAFNVLVEQYQDALYTLAYRIMGEPASAADATQEAFISAYRRLDTYRGGNFRAWLARIVTNTCYDELRRLKRRPSTSLEDLTHEDSNDEAPIADDAPTPEQALQQKELQRAIQACIDELGDEQRVTLVLSDVEGLSYQEIADQTNTQAGTVKSRLSRARANVRGCLQGFAELLPTAYRLTD